MNTFVQFEDRALRRLALQADEDDADSVCAYCRLRSDQCERVCTSATEADECVNIDRKEAE